MRRIGNVTAFYDDSDPLTNWHIRPFSVAGRTYSSVQQYEKFQKAILAGDRQTALAVLSTDDPRDHKRLGRQIRGFDKTFWEERREMVVLEALLAKFGQNQDFQALLQATGKTLLAEASTTNLYWGAGVAEDDVRIADPEKWPGLNRLGFLLMETRTRLLPTS